MLSQSVRAKMLRKIELKKELLRRKLLSVDEKYLIPGLYRKLFGDRAAKYIILKGGRGSGKTFAIVCFLIEESFKKEYEKSLFLFLREVQTSIEDSVYAVIVDLINQAQLTQYFDVKNNRIINTLTGVEFAFTGLRSTGGKTAFSQVNKIKGKHKVRYVFMDEAQDASEDSLNVLFPTVNRGGTVKFTPEYQKLIEVLLGEPDVDLTESRFLFAMNPNFDEDPVLAKVKTHGEQARIEHVNIFDLPKEFQDKQLLDQAESEKGEVYYDHVWLGAASHKLSGYPWIQCGEIRTNETIQCIAFIDPSFKGGDYTALSFVGIRGGRLVAWGYCWKKAWKACIDDICDLFDQYKPAEAYYEDNAQGNTPQDLFGDCGYEVSPRTSFGNKENRIYKVAYYVAHRLDLVRNHCNEEWYKQVTKYNEEAPHDDAPDSLASAFVVAGIITDKMKF